MGPIIARHRGSDCEKASKGGSLGFAEELGGGLTGPVHCYWTAIAQLMGATRWESRSLVVVVEWKWPCEFNGATSAFNL